MDDQSDLAPRERQEHGSGSSGEGRGRTSDLERDSPALARALWITASSFSGPLPPPKVLAAYEEALPGSAERILRMAEEQGTHRRSLETQEITANIRSQSRGQYLAFVLALLVTAGGIYLLATGHGVEGLVALLTPLAGLVALFLITRSREKQRAESSKLMLRAAHREAESPSEKPDQARSGS